MTEPQATHIKGGTLDLTLVSTDLYPNAHWKIHPTLTSDHFAIEITTKDAHNATSTEMELEENKLGMFPK